VSEWMVESIVTDRTKFARLGTSIRVLEKRLRFLQIDIATREEFAAR